MQRNRLYKFITFSVSAMLLMTSCGMSENDTTQPTAPTVESLDDSQLSETNNAEDATATNEEIQSDELDGETQTYSTGLAPDWRGNELNIIDDKYRNYYEIFVYSFCDSNDDGIGDIQGIISKLDYLNDGNPSTDDDLGITGIWLTPIMPSPSYHKYDTTDYYDIDPQFGSLDDFKQLIEECHKRGINIIMDLALNHTSGEHPWFVEACDYLNGLGKETPDSSECPYIDYYNFTKEKDGGYCEVTGTDYYYECRFNYDMPDLNLQNDAVIAEFEDIASFWLDMGIDGFRLDAVKYYVTGRDDLNIEILEWFNDYVKKINPNAYIVCENWTDQANYCGYYESGVDSLFDFAFADKDGYIAKTVNGKNSALSYGKALEAEEKLYFNYSDTYINAPFYTNHDMGRSAGYYAGDNSEAQTKMGNALNLLMSGNTFLYYGEEIGMKGSGADENKRAPMFWSDDPADKNICAGPPNMESPDMKYGSLAGQIESTDSIYQFVKDCIRLRNQIPTIARGKTTCIEKLSNDNICVLSKKYDSQQIYIVINVSDSSQIVDLNSLSDSSLTVLGELYASDIFVERIDNKITMPGYSIIIFDGASETETEGELSAANDNEEPGDSLEDGAVYVKNYNSEKEYKERHTGSVTYITDKTVIVSIFVDESEDVWTEAEKKAALNTCRIAYDGLKDILAEEYDTEIELIYDWEKNPDLYSSVRAVEDVPAYVTGEQEDWMYDNELSWIENVDYQAIMNKYDTDSIAFLYLVPHEGCSYSSNHFIDDGAKTWAEGCLLYLEDMYSPTYEPETPNVYAHELLHLFGAEDYYSDAKVFKKATYKWLENNCADDIMLYTYDMINGVYTTYPNEIHGSISPVTAYLIGIGDESAVEEVPELIKEEKGCFSGSYKDRPF